MTFHALAAKGGSGAVLRRYRASRQRYVNRVTQGAALRFAGTTEGGGCVEPDPAEALIAGSQEMLYGRLSLFLRRAFLLRQREVRRVGAGEPRG